jgi:hypothetical protein|tara:strand:+ start:393 stop:512 length:120 start_codon:yes stop_codon:yes gene_type:complete
MTMMVKDSKDETDVVRRTLLVVLKLLWFIGNVIGTTAEL